MNVVIDGKEFIPIEAVAVRASASTGTIRRMVRLGRIPPGRVLRRRLVWPAEEVEAVVRKVAGIDN